MSCWIPTSAAAKIVPYAFQDRQRVIACAFAVPPGPYEITGVLPVADDVPFYRVKSVPDAHERAISEPSLRPAPLPDALPRRPKAKAR